MKLVNKDESPICPKCRRRVIQLIHLNDNRTGQKMCRDCKRAMIKGDKIKVFRRGN